MTAIERLQRFVGAIPQDLVFGPFRHINDPVTFAHSSFHALCIGVCGRIHYWTSIWGFCYGKAEKHPKKVKVAILCI
jgi:hypothetical protein